MHDQLGQQFPRTAPPRAGIRETFVGGCLRIVARATDRPRPTLRNLSSLLGSEIEGHVQISGVKFLASNFWRMVFHNRVPICGLPVDSLSPLFAEPAHER